MAESQKVGGIHFTVGVEGAAQAKADLRDVGQTAETQGARIEASINKASGSESGGTGLRGMVGAAKAVRAALLQVALPVAITNEILGLAARLEEASAAALQLEADAGKMALELQRSFEKIGKVSLGSQLKDDLASLQEQVRAAVQGIQDKLAKDLGSTGSNNILKKIGEAIGIIPDADMQQGIADTLTTLVVKGAEEAKKRLQDSDALSIQIESDNAERDRWFKARKEDQDQERKWMEEREDKARSFNDYMLVAAQKLRAENDKMAAAATKMREEQERALEAIRAQVREQNSRVGLSSGGGFSSDEVLRELQYISSRIGGGGA